MDELSAFIIEDEADLAEIFSESLRAAGFQPEIIHDGLLASRRLAECVPDLIVLDMHLPGMDGSDLLRQISDDQRLRSTRVIVATADHNMTIALPRNPDMVLLKPISFGQLRDLSIRLKQLI